MFLPSSDIAAFVMTLKMIYSLCDMDFVMAENMTSEERRENYLCDITYVTNSELGFDYLRDNLAMESNSFANV